MALLNDAPPTDSEKKMKRKKERWGKRRKTRKAHHGSNGQDKGRWSELPYEILDLIVRRIFFIDLINLRAVCKPWRYYSYDNFQPLKQIPWLLGFSDIPTQSNIPTQNCSCKLIDPVYKKTYTVKDPKIKEKKLYDMEVHESKCGWVLMSSKSKQPSRTNFLLYTPFLTENNIIELPVLSSKFLFATFSTGPSTSQNKNNCVCLAFNNSDSGGVNISTYRCGDHTWRTQSFECFFPLSNVTSVVYSEGVFYCPSYIGSIGTFNVDREEWVVEEPKNKSVVTESQDAKYYKIHLIKSAVDGELLLVLTWKSSEGWQCPNLSAYRLDRSEMMWKRLRGLGDLSLLMATKGTSVAMELPEWEGRALLCWDGKVMYFEVPLFRQVHGRCYPCAKLYGSTLGQLKKPCWIEPSL